MKLLEPYDHPCLGQLKNRVVMAPMTRGHAGAGHLATDAMGAYYEARARNGAAVIITEGTVIHASADGYRNVPHIETTEQVASWRPVVERVRRHGTRFFCQLWHCGRISHPDFTGGTPPVSSTDRAATGINRQNGKEFGVPRRLDAHEMPAIYELYDRAAGNAMEAGFDGVELHLANGYLADQFFDSRVNDRQDSYGDSIANRCRFAEELTARLIERLGPSRVMVRISPARWMNGPHDWPDLDGMLKHLLPALAGLGLQLLDVTCANADYHATTGRVLSLARHLWPHGVIGGASLSPDDAEVEIAANRLELVTWGRAFIANPDLPRRWQLGAETQPFDGAMLSRLE